MSEMIERVAKALWESEPVIYAWGPQERHRFTWEDGVKRGLAGVPVFRQFARAAIAAMREPTEAMVRAGNNVIEPDERLFYKHIADDVFVAMIDTALK